MWCLRLPVPESSPTRFPAGPTVAWPDYTDLSRQCLSEVSDLARRAVPYTLLRITVRAETPVYRALRLNRTPLELPKGLVNDFTTFFMDFKREFAMQGVTYDDGA